MRPENQKELLREFSNASIENWRIEAENSLKGRPIESLNTSSIEDILVKPIYFSENSSLFASYPGFPPFLRGNEPGMFKKSSWDICQELSAYDPKEFNRIILEDLKNGQTAIHMRILNPGNFDQDNINGTFISCVKDFEDSFQNIDLTKHALSFTINSTCYKAIDLFLGYLEIKDYDMDQIKLFIDFDPIGELINDSRFEYNISEVLDKLSSLAQRINSKLYKSKTLGINGYIYSNKGATVVQELTFSLGSALEYIYKFLDKGFDIDQICSNIYFNLSVNNDFFMEIAKFRAARVLWSKIVAELGGNLDSQKMYIRAINSLRNKSSLDKHTNILRGTSEAISAILGGCEAITIRPYDIQTEYYNELSRRVARNTQLVLQNECNFNEVIDPSGGSYYIEELTMEILEKSFDLLRKIEEKNGIIECIKDGFIQDEINEIVNQRIINFNTRRETQVGVNKYTNLNDEISTNTNLEYYTKALEFAKQCIPIPIEFGNSTEFSSIQFLPDFKIASEIEKLRMNSEKYRHENGYSPKISALAFGTLKQYKGRFDFSKEFLSVGGIDLELSGPFTTIKDASLSFLDSKYHIFVICSDDESYPDFVPELVKIIKSNKPGTIAILAGFPKDHIESFKNAGIDIFIHLKSNIVTILQELHIRLNISK